jgi:predicted nucleotidyltransferase component of viral defense system
MVILPLIRKLRKKIHREIAFAQDVLIQEVFRTFNSAILHGGTAVWRCYQSNRFSEDLDFYISQKEKEKIEKFFDELKNLGFKILKRKLTKNALYSKLKYNEVEIRFEVLFKEIKKFATKEYEMADGTKIVVNTLFPEDLIKEKVETYLNRLNIRDLYDIFFLLDFAKQREIKNDLSRLLKNFKNPKNEKELKYLIIVGTAPKLEEMLKKIKKYEENKTHR